MTTFFQVFYISKLAINDFYTDAWGEDGAFHYTSELSEFMVSYIMRQELGGHATSFKFSLSSTDNEKKKLCGCEVQNSENLWADNICCF